MALGSRAYGKAGAAAVLLMFVVLGLVRYSSVDGDDLSASYVGCRVLAAGATEYLYQHDPVDFSEMGSNTVWARIADEAEFYGTLHPYVQTPLWAFGLRPLCTRTDFQGFERVFAVLEMLCFAGSIGLIARYWAPSLLNPVGLSVVLAVVWFCVPFRYAMVLMQTHVLFFAMTIAALILAERRRPGWAGLLLACAATVKLTPGVLVVYWLMTRKWKAAASTVVWSGMLGGLTVLAVGWPLTAAYLAEMHRISRVLLLAMNNQSLAAWWMGWCYPAGMAKEMTMLPLPTALRVGSTALMVGVTGVGGWLDWKRRFNGDAPVGAMMGLVAATVFAPISWTHYGIVLIAPLMMLWQENRQRREVWIWTAMAGVVLLSFRPITVDVLDWETARFAVVRSGFYASMLCLGVLGWVGLRARGSALVEQGTENVDVDASWAMSAD